MSAVRGTYRRGRIDLDSPVDWPDGSKVTIIPRDTGPGLSESDWPDTPETRAALLAKLEAIEPLELTQEDEVEIARAREAAKDASVRSVRKRMGLSP